jgi:uncharacterized protein
MKNIGLTNSQLALLHQVLADYSEIEYVKLYGSRAKGTFNERSDIDLAVFGENIERYLISDLLLELNDSDLPYLVDVQNYVELQNKKLIEHIDRVGVVVYHKFRKTD